MAQQPTDVLASISALKTDVDTRLITLQAAVAQITPVVPAVTALQTSVTAMQAAVGVLQTGVTALVAAIGTGTGGGGTGNTDFFPADPGIARFPSPEDSQILVFNGAISGRPYLKDSAGAVHQIKLDASGVPQYYKNGQLFAVFPGEMVAQCLVRQGGVYMQITSGIWKQVAANGSMYNATLPPAFNSGTNLPPLPPMPTPSAIAPGSSGNIINCGVGQGLATIAAGIAAAKAGDIVQIAPGLYNEPVPTILLPIILDGGGATLSGVGLTAQLAGGGKGLIVPRADCIIRNMTITGVAMDQTEGQLTSAIRPDAGCGYLTIQSVKAHGNQCAIGDGGFPVVISVSDSDISGNGLTTNTGSLTHNLYVGQECRKLTLTNVVSTGPIEAHAIKYRGPELVVNGGTFASAPGKPFDIPNGCTVPFSITGATIVKGASDPDHGILAVGEEAQDNGLAGGSINGGAIQANCANPSIISAGGTVVVSATTLLTGNKITSSGGGVVIGI